MYRKDISEIYYVNYIDIINERASSDYTYMLFSTSPHLPVSKVVKYTKKWQKIARRIPGISPPECQLVVACCKQWGLDIVYTR